MTESFPSKHTPGPWDYVASTEHHGPYVTSMVGDICDCYTMSNLLAASVRNGGTSYPIPFQGEQADANARLLAAAPRMFEALKVFAQRAITPGADAAPDDDRVTLFMKDCREALAAIVAATGKAS